MNVREEAEKLLKLFRQFEGRVPDEEMITLFESPLKIAIAEGKIQMLQELTPELKKDD